MVRSSDTNSSEYPRRERLEVEVDAVGAAIADRRDDLLREPRRARPLLPRIARWTLAWLVVHANTLTVSTTRVPWLVARSR